MKCFCSADDNLSWQEVLQPVQVSLGLCATSHYEFKNSQKSHKLDVAYALIALETIFVLAAEYLDFFQLWLELI